MVSILDKALEYLYYGWSVIPLKYKTKEPCIKWKKYQTQLPTPKEWESWVAEFKEVNIALICGRISNCYSIDCDGIGAIRYLALRGYFPDSPCIRTPRGLRWLISASNEALRTRNWSGEGWSMTFLGEGSCTVLPPSIHPSGQPYTWDCNNKMSPLLNRGPKFLYEVEDIKANKNFKVQVFNKEAIGEIGEGSRNRSLFKLGCSKVRKEKCTFEYLNFYLKSLNLYCNPPLEDSEIYILTKSIMKYA